MTVSKGVPILHTVMGGAERIIRVSALAIAFACSLAASNANAETPVAGQITGDVTWSPEGSPYVLSSNVTIAEGANLTIEPGVEVRPSEGNWHLNVLGTLRAVGTPADPIDISIGGEIRFLKGSGGSELAFVAVRDSVSTALANDADGAYELNGPWPEIHDVHLIDNYRAIDVWYPLGGDARFTEIHISGGVYGLLDGVADGTIAISRSVIEGTDRAPITFSGNRDPEEVRIVTDSNISPSARNCSRMSNPCLLALESSGYPVDVSAVWWGTTDRTVIDRQILDQHDNPGLPLAQIGRAHV